MFIQKVKAVLYERFLDIFRGGVPVDAECFVVIFGSWHFVKRTHSSHLHNHGTW